MPPRVPIGRPSMWSCCERSPRTRNVSIAGVIFGSPTARLLIFHAAERYRSISAGEMPSTVRDVVEAVGFLVGRQQRRDVDVEREQIADARCRTPSG